MLGTNDTPRLLVNVDQEHSPSHFDFWVVNGAWNGTYYNGHVTVHDCPSGSYSTLDKFDILCDNPDRLRSSDHSGGYQTVFDNFHDETYVAYKPQPVKYPASWDDDIAF
jgi:hypothetical protein